MELAVWTRRLTNLCRFSDVALRLCTKVNNASVLKEYLESLD